MRAGIFDGSRVLKSKQIAFLNSFIVGRIAYLDDMERESRRLLPRWGCMPVVCSTHVARSRDTGKNVTRRGLFSIRKNVPRCRIMFRDVIGCETASVSYPLYRVLSARYNAAKDIIGFRLTGTQVTEGRESPPPSRQLSMRLRL